jgi:hypothetical protein
MDILHALPQSLCENCGRGQNRLLSNAYPRSPTVLYGLQLKRLRPSTSAATVRTSQTLVLQATADRDKVFAVHSAKCCRMFPRQPQLLQLTAECLCIYTVTSRGCQHKQQCCHTSLNLTRLCNKIQVPFDSISLIIEPANSPIAMGTTLRQLHPLPINTNYFLNIHLNVILQLLLYSHKRLLSKTHSHKPCYLSHLIISLLHNTKGTTGP